MALPSFFFAFASSSSSSSSSSTLPCCGGGCGHDASETALLLTESVCSPRYDCGSSSYFLGATLASLWAWSLLALAFGLSFVIPYIQSLRRYPPLRYNNSNGGNSSREEKEEDDEDQLEVIRVACPNLEQERALAEVDPACPNLENQLENSVDASACSDSGHSRSLKRSLSLPELWQPLELEKLSLLRRISTTSDLLPPPLSCNNIIMVRPRKTQSDLQESSSSSSSSPLNETLLFSSIVHSNSSPFLTCLRHRKPKSSQLESQSVDYYLPRAAIGHGWKNTKLSMDSATFEEVNTREELSQTREKVDDEELKGKVPDSIESNNSFDLSKDSKEMMNEVDCLQETVNMKDVVNSLTDLSAADVFGPELRPEPGNMSEFVKLLTELEDTGDLHCSSYSCLQTQLEASSGIRVCPPHPPCFQTQIDVDMAESLNVEMCSGDVSNISSQAGFDGAMNTIGMRELQPKSVDARNLPSCFQTQVDDNMVEGLDVQTCSVDAGGGHSVEASLDGVINMIEMGDLQTESEDATSLPFCSQTQADANTVEKIVVVACVGDTANLSTQASLDCVTHVTETSDLQMEPGGVGDLPFICFPAQVDENTDEKIDVQRCSAEIVNLSVRADLDDVNMIERSKLQVESGDADNLLFSSFQTQEDVNMDERPHAQSCVGDTANLSIQASSDCAVNVIEMSNLQMKLGDVDNVLFSCLPAQVDVNAVERFHEQTCSRDADILSVQSSMDVATKSIEISDLQTELGDISDLSLSCIQTQVDVNTVQSHDVQTSAGDMGNLSVQAIFDGVVNEIEMNDLQLELEDVMNPPFSYLQTQEDVSTDEELDVQTHSGDTVNLSAEVNVGVVNEIEMNDLQLELEDVMNLPFSYLQTQEDVNTDEDLDAHTHSGDTVNLSAEVNLGGVINMVETSNLQMESGDAVDFTFSCFQTEVGVNFFEKLSVEPGFDGVLNTFETIGLQSESGDSIDSPLSCFQTQVDVNEAEKLDAQICTGDTVNLSVETSFDGVINKIETSNLQMESGDSGDLPLSSIQSQEQMNTESEIDLLEDAKLEQGKPREDAENVEASSSCPEMGDLDISKAEAKDAEASTWWDMDAVLIEPNIEDTPPAAAAAAAAEEEEEEEEKEWNGKPKLITNWFGF